MKALKIPNGCCELVIEKGEPKPNCFKVDKRVLECDELPKKGEMIIIYMEGTGFFYNGEIYHKSKEYVYIYLY